MELLLERIRHGSAGQAVAVRQLDRGAVTLHVVEAGGAVAEMMLELAVGVGGQFILDEFVQQLLCPPAFAEVEQALEEPHDVLHAHDF